MWCPYCGRWANQPIEEQHPDDAHTTIYYCPTCWNYLAEEEPEEEETS